MNQQLIFTPQNNKELMVELGEHKTYKITTYKSNEFEEIRKFYTGVFVYSFNPDFLYIQYKDGYKRPDSRPSSLFVSLSEVENIEEMEEKK